jgi:hypothetical protein
MNDLIGRGLNDPLVLAGFSVVPQSPDKNLNDVTRKAVENYYGLIKQQREIKQLKEDLHDEDDDNQTEILRASLTKAELNLKDIELKIKTQVEKLLLELDVKYKAWQLADLTKQKAQKEYEYNKVKHELGLISDVQWKGLQLAHDKAVNEEKAAAYAYYLALRNIELAEQGIIDISILGNVSTNN